MIDIPMIRVAKLDSGAILPRRKTPTDAGLDLYAFLEREGESITIEPLNFRVVNTGITIEIPTGYFGWITNKSRNNFLVGAGIVDQGYQGELLVKIINPYNKSLVIKNGDAIAQLIILPCKIFDIDEVQLSEIHRLKTARGSSGGIVSQVFISEG